MRHPSLIPLSRDHHRGLALALKCRKQALGQMKPMGAEGLRERAEELRHFVSNHLEQHFQAEEEILFPLIRSCVSQSHPLIEDLLEGHEEIRKGALRLEGKTDLAKILFDLGDLLERHIRKEERELFPLFEACVTPAKAERVNRDIERILKNR